MITPTKIFDRAIEAALVSFNQLFCLQNETAAEEVTVQSIKSNSSQESLSTSTESLKEPKTEEIEVEDEWKADRHVFFTLCTLSIILFVVALDATILVSALPAVAEALSAGTTAAFWIGTSYLLTSATFQPLFACLADVFGRRWLLFTAVLLFSVGTVMCCAANNVTLLLTGRTIQGIGGGGIFALNLIIIADTIPLRQRSKYIGYIQLVFAIGTIIGPVVGGAIVEHTTWRWIFLINLPFCAIGLLIVPFVIRNGAPSDLSLLEKLASIDWLGAFLFTTGLASFLVGVSWGGSQYPWLSAATLCPICLGLTAVATTILWNKYGTARPFLRLQVFDSVSAIACYFCTVLQGFLLYVTLYYTAFWLTVVKDRSATATGIGLLPASCFMIPTSAIVGILITRLGRFRWAVWGGWAITVVAHGLLTLLHVDTPTPVWATLLIVIGMGQGLLLISLNLACQAIASSKDPANAPRAAAMYSFMRSLGLCLGVAIGGTIFTNMFSTRLSEMGLPVEVAKNAEGFIAILKAMPDSVPAGVIGEAAARIQQQVDLKIAYVSAYAWGFNMLFKIVVGFSGLGFLMSLLVRGYSIDMQVEAQRKLSVREAHRRASIV